jgi:hypothetical protein
MQGSRTHIDLQSQRVIVIVSRAERLVAECCWILGQERVDTIDDLVEILTRLKDLESNLPQRPRENTAQQQATVGFRTN